MCMSVVYLHTVCFALPMNHLLSTSDRRLTPVFICDCHVDVPNVIFLSPNDLRLHTFNVFRRPVTTTYGKLSDAHLTVILQVPSFAALLWETFCAISAVNLSDF